MAKKNLWVKKADEEIDAILPFMSLLLVIIPVLLANLSFYQFRVIAVSTPGTPKESTEPSAPKEDLKKEKMVTAYLELLEKKAKISFLDEETAEPMSSDEQALDGKGAQVLFELLKKNKKEYPKLENLMLKVNKDLPYEQIASFLTHFKRPLDETLAKDKSKKDQASNFINIVLLREFAGSSAQAEASETKVEP